MVSILFTAIMPFIFPDEQGLKFYLSNRLKFLSTVRKQTANNVDLINAKAIVLI